MAEQKILTIDDILAAPDLAEEVVEVPEWGGAVKIRSLTRGQIFDIRRKSTIGEQVNEERQDMLTFIEGVVVPKFNEEHLGRLRQKNAGAFARVLRRIGVISGTSAEAQREAEKSFRNGHGEEV